MTVRLQVAHGLGRCKKELVLGPGATAAAKPGGKPSMLAANLADLDVGGAEGWGAEAELVLDEDGAEGGGEFRDAAETAGEEGEGEGWEVEGDLELPPDLLDASKGRGGDEEEGMELVLGLYYRFIPHSVRP